MRNNDRRDRITALIDRIDGNPFPAHINDIAALRKLTSFKLKGIRFTHNNVNFLINSGTWCNVYQTAQEQRTILLRSGCRPQAYLDSITSATVDAMAMRIYCSIDDLPTLLKTLEGLSYKFSVQQRNW
jgi:hypothetical protein